MNYQLTAPPNPLSSPPRSQTQSSQASTISLTSTPSPYTRTQNALTQDMYAMQGPSSTPMDQHPQYLMSPPPQGRGHGSPYQQVLLINHVDQTQQQDVVAGRGKRATPKSKGGGGRKTPHAAVQAPPGAPEAVDSDEVQVVVDMGVPAGGRRGGRPPPMDKEAKKERTRENEKERRQHQKTGMQRLRKLIPPPQVDDENAKKKIINDGQVVNLAADYIEKLLETLNDAKKDHATVANEYKKLKQKFIYLTHIRNKEMHGFRSIISGAKSDQRSVDELISFAIRTAKKLELATNKLRHYHEQTVKNSDKNQPEIDLRLFEVEMQRLPNIVRVNMEELQAKHGDELMKALEQAYLQGERDKARRESALAVEGPSGEVGRTGNDNNFQVDRQQGGRGQVVVVGGQQQHQMHLAINKQQHRQMQMAVSKQQHQMLMGVQGNQQPGVRAHAQVTQMHQVNQVTKIIPPGMRLPNIGNTGNRPGQQGQVRFITLKQEANGEPPFLRCQGPNSNMQILGGGNFVMTQSPGGQPLILRANDATQLYSLANLQQEHQASVGGQGGRVVMGVVKPQMLQNAGGVQGQVRGPSVQGQGPRGPVIRPQQLQFRVVKRDLFQDGGQVRQGQQLGSLDQAIHQQQQRHGGQQQSPAGQFRQRHQRTVGQAVQQQQGPGIQLVQQQQQSPASQVILQQQQRFGGQATQQGPGFQQQRPSSQGTLQQQGSGIQPVHQDQSSVSQGTQQQQGPEIQQPGPGAQTTQQQSPASQTIPQQPGPGGEDTQSQALVPCTPGTPVMQPQQLEPVAEPTGLLAIKQEKIDEDEVVSAQQQPGGQTGQAQHQGPGYQQFGPGTIKNETQDQSAQDQQANVSGQEFMDDSMEPVFGDYTFEALAGLDSQTGPFEGMMGELDSSYGLLEFGSRDDGFFSRGSQATTSRGSFSGEQGGLMDGFDLRKIKDEPVDEDVRMEEDPEQEPVDISRIKQEDEEETDDEDGGSDGEVEGAAGGSPRLPTWKIDGIGDEVVSEPREVVDFANCSVPIENVNGGRAETGGGGPTTGVKRSGEESGATQKPVERNLEYEVQMLTVEEWRDHDELFKKHPLFKQNFLWGEQKDPKKCKEVLEIIKSCWEEVVEERKIKDMIEAQEEIIKKMKVEQDDDYEEKGKGKKGGSRGRKKRR